MTQYERMIAGKMYDPSDKQLTKLRVNAHQLCKHFNDTDEDMVEARENILQQLLGKAGKDAWIEPFMKFDYGINTIVGDNFYANFGLTVLDSCPVIIGNDVMIGPNVSIVTAMHSLLPRERNVRTRENGQKYDLEYSKPIKIGNNVWIATGCIINPGVTIGDNVVIGSGSVVTKDIPSGSVAFGNPCKVVREITEQDSLEKFSELYK